MNAYAAAAYLDLATEITAVLRLSYGRPTRADAWHIIGRPEVRFEGRVLIPDVAGWRRDRLRELPTAGPIDIAPEWICEVFSPVDVRLQRIEKPAAYHKAGVRWFWRIFADQAVLESLERSEMGWRIVSAHGDEVVRIAPFAEIEIDLALLWGAPPA